jgi:hypothetical protein
MKFAVEITSRGMIYEYISYFMTIGLGIQAIWKVVLQQYERLYDWYY